MRPKKILLAEDNDKDSELTIEALKMHNISNDIDRVCDDTRCAAIERASRSYGIAAQSSISDAVCD